MKLRLKATSANNTAARIMQGHLEAAGIGVVRGRNPEEFDATLCWGASSHNPPVLNGNANLFDKREAILRFDAMGLSTPQILSPQDVRFFEPYFTYGGILLGRNLRHMGGTDIQIARTFQDAMKIAPDVDFFSVYAPSQTEYRVWVFRDRVLAVYEKTFKGEGVYDGIQRNHNFDFKFNLRHLGEYPSLLDHIGPVAVRALHLDFGAVDILDCGARFPVLEVNTAPHIDSPERVSGRRLAKEIIGWVKEGCPSHAYQD